METAVSAAPKSPLKGVACVHELVYIVNYGDFARAPQRCLKRVCHTVTGQTCYYGIRRKKFKSDTTSDT